MKRSASGVRFTLGATSHCERFLRSNLGAAGLKRDCFVAQTAPRNDAPRKRNAPLLQKSVDGQPQRRYNSYAGGKSMNSKAKIEYIVLAVGEDTR